MVAAEKAKSRSGLSSKENKEKVKLPEEQEEKVIVKSKKRASYEVVKSIAVGTSSTVYLVHKLLGKGSFVKMAMKAENEDIKSGQAVFALANEIRFLVEFQKRWRDQVRDSDHLQPICDFGYSKKYKFMIVPLLGPNLDQLRDEMKSEFSSPTAARLSLQALDAISMLHSIGMLHTRVEPSHFCIGTEHRRNLLYLVGFGHITTFSNNPTWNRKTQYAPRAFASRNSIHMELECWFFTMLDLFDRTSLPWNKFRNMSSETIEERKLLLFASAISNCRGGGLSNVPPEVRTICAIMNKHNYRAADLRFQLIKYLNRISVSLTSPYEWELSDEYRASKKTKPDAKTYEKNVQNIAKCTVDLLKDYVPPSRKKDESKD
ncbi:hypothetical protein V3C99_011198 [Haemonchus contortus]